MADRLTPPLGILASDPCQVTPGRRLSPHRRRRPAGSKGHCCAYRSGLKTATPLPWRSCHGPICSKRTPKSNVNRRVNFHESVMNPEKVLYCIFTVGEKFDWLQLLA